VDAKMYHKFSDKEITPDEKALMLSDDLMDFLNAELRGPRSLINRTNNTVARMIKDYHKKTIKCENYSGIEHPDHQRFFYILF